MSCNTLHFLCIPGNISTDLRFLRSTIEFARSRFYSLDVCQALADIPYIRCLGYRLCSERYYLLWVMHPSSEIATTLVHIAAKLPRYRSAIETYTNRGFDVRFYSEFFGHKSAYIYNILCLLLVLLPPPFPMGSLFPALFLSVYGQGSQTVSSIFASSVPF